MVARHLERRDLLWQLIGSAIDDGTHVVKPEAGAAKAAFAADDGRTGLEALEIEIQL
jgi:hypothetical protein